MDEVEGSHHGSSSFFIGDTRQLGDENVSAERTIWNVKCEKHGRGEEMRKNRQANVARGREKGFGSSKWFVSKKRRLNGKTPIEEMRD